ncbi:MAG TPA: CoA-binding protein, partial [Terriglobales bacterium]|nr:CoA-binding protein [Terriglobales bacterium]
MASKPESDPIRDLFSKAKTIAVVGLSDSPLRPSHGVSAYMQSRGHKIIP